MCENARESRSVFFVHWPGLRPSGPSQAPTFGYFVRISPNELRRFLQGPGGFNPPLDTGCGNVILATSR